MEVQKRHEDIIGVKVGPSWFSVDLRALLRRWTEKPKIDPVGVVAQRFVQIFRDHGIAPTQIPRFIPAITLEKLVDSNALLSALTPSVLDRTAELFRINREWLDGMGSKIYRGDWCYKHPEPFLDMVKNMDLDGTLWPVVAFCGDDRFDYRKNKEQPIVLALVEKIGKIGESEVVRYHIYNDGWDWGYWKCRIQIKAMLRVLFERYGIVVPLFVTTPKVLKEIEAGWRVPRHFLMHRSRRASLEDFSLSPEESHVSKEAEELPEVERYIQAYDLRKRVGLPEKEATASDSRPSIYEFT